MPGQLRARGKSALASLTCGYDGQQPRSSFLSGRSTLHLHGQHVTRSQVRATWRSVSGRQSPESSPDRRLSTEASEQVNGVTDDFLRGGGDDAVLVLLGGPRLRAAEEAGAQRDRLGAEVEGGCDLLSGRDAPSGDDR